jgi:ankyrin repeat protein
MIKKYYILFCFIILIIASCNENKKITNAARNGQINLVQKLIDKGVDVNKVDKYGKNALLYATSYNHKDTVEMLLRNGAVVDMKNSYGETSLKLAIFKGYIDIVKLLIEYGADTNAEGNKGVTALMAAAANGQEEIVETLLKNNANPNLTAFGDNTVLMSAVKYPRIVKILIMHNANVSQKDSFGRSALIWAVHNKNIESCKILLENGADPNLSDQKGETPLSLARKKGMVKISELLKMK